MGKEHFLYLSWVELPQLLPKLLLLRRVDSRTSARTGAAATTHPTSSPTAGGHASHAASSLQRLTSAALVRSLHRVATRMLPPPSVGVVLRTVERLPKLADLALGG